MTLRATIFDMDGLLIDSEVLWHQAEHEILTDLGVVLPEDLRATKGMYVTEVVAYWHSQYPWAGATIEQVVDRLLARVGDLVESEGRLLAGAERALDLTGVRGPLALASSTPTALITRCLDRFDLRARFTSIHSAEDEEFGKPHPAVFLRAANELGVSARECLVVEDSAAGVLAGKAARMEVVAVPDAAERAAPTFALADLVLDSLDEWDESWLDRHFA